MVHGFWSRTIYLCLNATLIIHCYFVCLPVNLVIRTSVIYPPACIKAACLPACLLFPLSVCPPLLNARRPVCILWYPYAYATGVLAVFVLLSISLSLPRFLISEWPLYHALYRRLASFRLSPEQFGRRVSRPPPTKYTLSRDWYDWANQRQLSGSQTERDSAGNTRARTPTAGVLALSRSLAV